MILPPEPKRRCFWWQSFFFSQVSFQGLLKMNFNPQAHISCCLFALPALGMGPAIEFAAPFTSSSFIHLCVPPNFTIAFFHAVYYPVSYIKGPAPFTLLCCSRLIFSLHEFKSAYRACLLKAGRVIQCRAPPPLEADTVERDTIISCLTFTS